MTRLVRICTPAYRGQVSLRYALGLAQLVQDLGVVESPFRIECIDGAPGQLITNRNVMLTKALAAGMLDVVLWLDADCALVYQDPAALYRFLVEATVPRVAAVGVACARRAEGNAPGSGRNVVPLDMESAPRPQWSPYEVESVGLGITAWNMRWWRSALKDARVVDGALHFFEWSGGITEDYRACRFVGEQGGQVLVDPRIGSWHDGMVVEATVGKVLQ